MRNYIILNGNNSNEITGLLIQSLPPISKPLMRTAIEEIDGRDGDIVTNLGYSAYDKEVSIGLYGSYDVDEVIKYFNDNSKGQVTFSNEPDKYYNYEIINQIDFERLIRFKTAIVTLHCQPFKYPTEETPVEINIQNINNEAEEMDLDNTADAPMTLSLKGNTSQASDPTPDSPVDVNVVSGDNTIEICGKNLFTGIFRQGTNADLYATARIYCDSNYWLEAGQEYTFSTNMNTNTYRFAINMSNTTFPSSTMSYDSGWKRQASFTFTPSESGYLGVPISRVDNANFTPSEIEDINWQLEKGSTATEYEAYTGNSQLISLGVENLLPNEYTSQTVNNLVVTKNSDNSITINGTASDNTTIRFNSTTFSLESGNYTISTGNTLPTGVKIDGWHSTATNFTSVASGTNKTTFNLASSVSNVRFQVYIPSGTTVNNLTIFPMLEKGTKANSYTPYGTIPIELCKSSDGTKKDGLIYVPSTDKLYKHWEIGKVVLDGSENDWTSWATTGFKLNNFINGNGTDSLVLYPILSNYFKAKKQDDIYTGQVGIQALGGNMSALYIRHSSITTLNDFKTWLGTHNTIVQYILATPYDEEIDNDKLKQQVKALYQNAKSYDPITHITQNANDKPFILNATAVQKGTDTGIVDNDGNIYSKPTLDIEGNGIVAIYLNGNQMFSVDLSNSSECIIDVTNLEAYDPETNELMNRQVTGDYSKFILPVGENQVKVSGNVTKTTISDYVRWL